MIRPVLIQLHNRQNYTYKLSHFWGQATVNYAVAHGARAMNMSFGQYFCTDQHVDPDTQKLTCYAHGFDPDLLTALENARDNGVIAVCAAGNSGANNDASTPLGPFGPANMPPDNLISVAASDQSDARAVFSVGSSNYGVKTVDLAAPGKDIYGLINTFNGNGTDLANYSLYEGTSQAAPHVTGTIALLAAKYGWEDYHGLRDRVLMGTDDVSAWAGVVRTRGRLNANKALHARTLVRNLSTRARVENGDRVMIGGFIISDTTNGTGTLRIAIRGLGPSLDPFVSVATLANPKLILNRSDGTLITSNDNWGTLTGQDMTDFVNAGLDEFNGAPISSLEEGIVRTLSPGSYTVILQNASINTGFGVGEFEIYELENGVDQQTRLLNVSTRCLVGINDEKAIAGVILGDPSQSTNTTIPKRSLLMLGKGPSLPSNIAGKLANPVLTLYNSAGTQMSTNNDWSSATASVVKAADGTWSTVVAATDEMTENGIAPSYLVESALWPILKSGLYTVQLTGSGNTTGVGLVEMYEY